MWLWMIMEMYAILVQYTSFVIAFLIIIGISSAFIICFHCYLEKSNNDVVKTNLGTAIINY